MRVKIFEELHSLYTTIVDDLLSDLKSVHTPQVALPTGATATPLYQELKRRQNEIRRWSVYPLDEYLGLSTNHPDSFAKTLETQFYAWARPYLQKHYTWQNDRKTIEIELSKHPLDYALLGVGVNGHVAFNEPGSLLTDSTREIALHSSTRTRNFGDRWESSPTHAVTLGMKELFASRRIAILATGANKRPALTRAIEGETTDVPLSLLLRHSNITLYLDRAAAPVGLAAQSFGDA
jgi:glucosamine-6-phosphate deaminase